MTIEFIRVLRHVKAFIVIRPVTLRFADFQRIALLVRRGLVVGLVSAEIGIEIKFEGEGVNEKGYIYSVDETRFIESVGKEFLDNIKSVKNAVIEVDSAYFRPTEVELLIGDATKSRTKLNWTPEYDLKSLVEDMMRSDVKIMKKETYLKEGGFRILNYFE